MSLSTVSAVILIIGAIAIIAFVIHGLWFSEKAGNRKLRKDEVELSNKIILSIEKNSIKSGIFSKLKTFFDSLKLKKTLGLSKFKPDFESISRLKQELEVSKLECDEKIIETRIHNIGNIHQLLLQIKELKKRQKKSG